MTHSEDLKELRKQMISFLNDNFAALNEGDTAATLEAAIDDLDTQIAWVEECEAEDNPIYQRPETVWNKSELEIL